MEKVGGGLSCPHRELVLAHLGGILRCRPEYKYCGLSLCRFGVYLRFW